MELIVYNIDGTNSGDKLQIPEKRLEQKTSTHAVYLAVKAQNANSRQGTADTKTRAMVRGGGKKPWKQKGRGAARAGTSRSPIWVGGGRVFGPHPRDYRMKLPKKVKTLARTTVYGEKAQNDQITVVKNFKLNNPKTKEMYGILQSLGVHEKKTLLIIAEHDHMILRAGRNIPKLQIRVVASESTYDLLNCERLVIQEGAFDKISGVIKG